MPSITKQNPNVPKKVKTIEADLWGNQLHRTLLYGHAATGKTTLAATWPSPLLWLVCSGSGEPAGMQSIDTPHNRSRITPKMVDSVQKFTDISQDTEVCSQYATVVLDHIGGYYSLILKEVLGRDEIPVVKNWGMASIQEYGIAADRLKLSLNRFFTRCPSKIVILGHEKTYENKLRPETNFNGVNLSDKNGEWVHGVFDSLFQCFLRQKYKTVTEEIGEEKLEVQTTDKDGVEYCLRLGGDRAFATKIQTPKRGIPEEIVSPTYEKLKKALGV